MRDIAELRQQVAFEVWADGAQIDSLEGVADPPEQLLAVTWHLVSAIDTWLARIEQRAPLEPFEWRTPARHELRPYFDRVCARLEAFVASVDEAALDGVVAYGNSKGRAYESRVRDVLQHLFLHGAEHRGQIAQEVGRLGGQPVETEYIFWLRGD